MALKDQLGGSVDPATAQEAVGHLLEPGETVRAVSLGTVDKGVTGQARAAVVLTEAYVYIIRMGMTRLNAKEVLIKYPLQDSQVWRKGTKLHVNDSSLRLGVFQFGQADRLIEAVHG